MAALPLPPPLPLWRWRRGSDRFFKKSSRCVAAAVDFLKIHRGSGAATFF